MVGGLSLGLVVAGLASPWIGRAIERWGGRLVLAASAVLLAGGQLVLAASHAFPVFLAAWVLMGAGMGAGLYDPAFATLGRLYGQRARSAITTLTLFGGFASTICWPLSAYLETHYGWRVTCAAYAAFQILAALPIYLFAMPREATLRIAPRAPPSKTLETSVASPPRPGLFPLMACAITLSSMLSAVMSVHLITILQASGLSLAVAVGLGATVGPSQVAARAVEMAIARYHHPIWTKLASTFLVAAGISLMWIGGPFIWIALASYGAGIGLESIARGTLPLAVFGPKRYPVLMGKIASPSLIAQAAAPSLGALLLQWGGANLALGVIASAAVLNVTLAVVLYCDIRQD